jgi:hypothetical protein
MSFDAEGALLMDAFCACNVSVANKATMVTIERNNRFIQPPEQDLMGCFFLVGTRLEKKPEYQWWESEERVRRRMLLDQKTISPLNKSCLDLRRAVNAAGPKATKSSPTVCED